MTKIRLARPLLAASLLLTFFMPTRISEADDGDSCDDEPPIQDCSPDDDDYYTGYWWKADSSVCVPGMVTIQTSYTPAPPYSFGAALWYDPYIMEATARYRGLSLDGFLDGVALMASSDVGRTVWLRRPDHDWEGPFLVVDTAARGDVWANITTRGTIVEVGFQTAARWGFVDAAQNKDGIYQYPYKVNFWRIDGVEVLKMDEIPSCISNYEPLDFVEWWSARAEFVGLYDVRAPYAIPKDHPKFPGRKWMASDPPVYMNTYDDWFEFLFPGDPRYKFDLPNNYRSSLVDDICVSIDAPTFRSSGFRKPRRLEDYR